MSARQVTDDVRLRITFAFLSNRLMDKDVLDWAIKLSADQQPEREAILFLLNDKHKALEEPWYSAWALVEESWQQAGNSSRMSSISALRARQRIASGHFSNATLSDLVLSIQPKMKVQSRREEYKKLSRYTSHKLKVPKNKKIGSLIAIRFDGAEVINPHRFGIDKIDNLDFLTELANKLEGIISHVLSIAKRVRDNSALDFLVTGQVNRVYYVQAQQLSDEHEPDEFHHGIAAAVKTLYAAIIRIGEISPQPARVFIQRWRFNSEHIFLRLWAAVARNESLALASEVAEFLILSDNILFWGSNRFPEVAELRAIRFKGLNAVDRENILKRILKGPPRSYLKNRVSSERLATAHNYYIARELRRLEIGGASLPEATLNKLRSLEDQFPDLKSFERIDSDFTGMPKARWVAPNPDNKFNQLSGDDRLVSLEKALSTVRETFDHDPSSRASDWVRVPQNAQAIFSDLQTSSNRSSYPLVWNELGSYMGSLAEGSQLNTIDDKLSAKIISDIILSLTDQTLKKAISGISSWLSRKSQQFSDANIFSPLWQRLWPIAADATNESNKEVTKNEEIDTDRFDSDILNSPAGMLLGLFFSSLPNLQKIPKPFQTCPWLLQARDMIIGVTGRAKIIGLYRMIENAPYFLRADPVWTQTHLLNELSGDTRDTSLLWQALARPQHNPELMTIVGDAMVLRASDERLGRETRNALIWKLTLQSLWAYLESRTPAVPHARVQQMLRSIDDELRGRAADAVPRFVSDLASGGSNGETFTPEKLFHKAAKPFLNDVWPQERSLATPGVSRSLVELPSVSGDAFADAFVAIERFLVPFDCWSLLDYGLYGADGDEVRLARINNSAKAAALLSMLDLTIGHDEGAVVPTDLGQALQHIQSVDQNLATSPRFRRLATLTRK